jgi:cell division protein FtsI (penicillin-binding protein 3)
MNRVHNNILIRVVLLYAAVLLAGAAIMARAVQIYTREGKELRELARNQEIRTFTLESNRGNILADESDLLATSVPIFDIRMDVGSPNISDADFNGKVDSLALSLSTLFPDKSKKYFKSKLINARKKNKRYQLLRRKVTYDQLQVIRTFPILRRGKIKGGLITIQRTRRERPFGELAARTIGFVNEKENLYVGLEGSFNDVLKGTDGRQVRRRINHGDWVPVHDKNEAEPVNGKDIKTTIDINIQDVAEQALLKQLLYHEAKMGTAVVMEVQTGQIKAMANLHLDPKDGKYKEDYNFAVGKRIEPGSTFKLASIMALLELKKVRLADSLFFSHPYVNYGSRRLVDAHLYHHGRFTIREAFEHSSNMGISKITFEAFKNNPARYVDQLYAMELNKPTGIKIKGEPAPYIKHPVKNKKAWWKTSLPWMSIGYEVMLTPLQLLTFYNAVANNGKMVKPMLVTEIQQDGKTIQQFSTTVVNEQIASPRTIRLAQSLLEGVVLRGTGKKLKNNWYKIAGKTGTAQISEGTGYHGNRRYNATFVGYFPADNPRYSIIVVVNEPTKNGYYGALVSGPVFKEIADKIYATSISLDTPYLSDTATKKIPMVNLPAWYDDINRVLQEFEFKTIPYPDKSNWVEPEKQGHRLAFTPVNFSNKTIPDVRGMSVKDAVFALENMGIQTHINGRGKVVAQSVKPGTEIKKNMRIELRLGTY